MATIVIVAHPDDETLWCGGRMLTQPEQDWIVLTLCRASDAERARRFAHACAELGATGILCDLDDEPAQIPLESASVKGAILSALPRRDFAAIYTHGPLGEYTRHRRHEECCSAVVALYVAGELSAERLNLFAYDDAGGHALPKAAVDADELYALPAAVVEKKSRLVTEVYGFAHDSWEARAVPAVEGYYVHSDTARLTSFIAGRRPAP